MGVPRTPGVGSAGPFQSLRQATLPAQFSASAASSRYAEVAKGIGIEGEGDKELTTALVKRLVELAQAIGVPQRFQEMGIEEGQFLKKVEVVSEYVLKAGPTVFSPRVPSPDELTQLFLAAFHGDLLA